MSDRYPPEIERLHDALSRLRGVVADTVSTGIQSISKLPQEMLSLPDLAHLPHAALRRTGGGVKNEALVQCGFSLSRDETGWRALEFLAWFFRDQARGWELVQVRPFALPPVAGPQVQLGQSLQFDVDLFCPDTGEDLSRVLKRVNDIAAGLELAIAMYDQMLRDRGDAGLLHHGDGDAAG
jgi:hypothetical protein